MLEDQAFEQASRDDRQRRPEDATGFLRDGGREILRDDHDGVDAAPADCVGSSFLVRYVTE